MSDFYTVLRRSLDRADAPDEEQRQEIYDRLRAVIVRKLDAHRPRLKDTEFRSRLVAFDAAVVRIEDEIAASFAAADDVFDELPYEAGPAAPQPVGGADQAYAAAVPRGPLEEATFEDDDFVFTDEDDRPLGEYEPEEAAQPATTAYGTEPLEDDPATYDPEDFEPEPTEEYEPEAYEPEAYETETYAEPEAEPEQEWAAEAEALPEIEEDEVVETAGPSTMWGSAIDLAWDETTAQWHDPEEPVRPVAPPVTIPRDVQSHPDAEWDRRLQMALVEETVRSHGSAAAPEWVADDGAEPDGSVFFEEGQWDGDGIPPVEGTEFAPARSGGRFGAVTSRLRSLSPARLLGRSKAERPVREAAIDEGAPSSRAPGGKVEPGFGMDVVTSEPAVQRRTSVRSIALTDREEALADAPASPLRAFRDDDDAPPEPVSRRSRAETPPPDRPSTRAAGATIRPVRPTPAPAPSRAEGRPERTPPPPRRTGPAPAFDDEAPAGTDDRVSRPAVRRAAPPLPVETMPARPAAQRGLPPRNPPHEAGTGDQRNLAPAGNRAMRYLGSDPDDPPEGGSATRESPVFEDAIAGPQRRSPPPPPPSRNAPPEGRRLVYEKSYGSKIFTIAVVGAIVVVLAVCAFLFVPGLFGSGSSTEGTGTTGNAGIVLFGGTDPLVFQAGPDNPVIFEGDTAGGLVRVVSSTAGTARASIGPGIADGVEGREVRIRIDVRSTPGRPASTLRLAYLRGGTLLEWRTVNVAGEFAIVDAIWTIPTGVPSTNGDALLIAPGVPGDGTAVDIRRITMDVGG